MHPPFETAAQEGGLLKMRPNCFTRPAGPGPLASEFTMRSKPACEIHEDQAYCAYSYVAISTLSKMPIVELHRADRTKESSKLLQKFAFDDTSQFGEDGILEEVFKRIGTTNKWCVEFGAWDGKLYSNTWRLIAKFDWSAVLIEGMEDRARDLAQLHKGSSKVHVQNCFVSWTGENRLDNLLAKTPIPRQFDLLSIDIDGNDYHVWNSVERYQPRVVIIEINPTASNDLLFVQDADAGLNQGCSLRALIELAKSKDYELAATTRCNAIFVTKSEFSKLGIEDNSIDAMHFADLTTELFQGYDGSMFVAGLDVLVWQGKKIDHEALQIIPKGLRKYPPPKLTFFWKLRGSLIRRYSYLSSVFVKWR